jgi:hypothetical protein
MCDHLANDDNTFSVSAVTSALTIQCQNPYRGRVLEVTTQKMPAMDIASIHIRIDCCQTKQQDSAQIACT